MTSEVPQNKLDTEDKTVSSVQTNDDEEPIPVEKWLAKLRLTGDKYQYKLNLQQKGYDTVQKLLDYKDLTEQDLQGLDINTADRRLILSKIADIRELIADAQRLAASALTITPTTTQSSQPSRGKRKREEDKGTEETPLVKKQQLHYRKAKKVKTSTTSDNEDMEQDKDKKEDEEKETENASEMSEPEQLPKKSESFLWEFPEKSKLRKDISGDLSLTVFIIGIPVKVTEFGGAAVFAKEIHRVFGYKVSSIARNGICGNVWQASLPNKEATKKVLDTGKTTMAYKKKDFVLSFVSVLD